MANEISEQDLEHGHRWSAFPEAGHLIGRRPKHTNSSYIREVASHMKESEVINSHKDAFGRKPDSKFPLVRNGKKIDEAYLSPTDGRLRSLIVQGATDLDNDCTWGQTRIRSAHKPILLSLVNLVFSSTWSAVLMYLPAVIIMGACIFFLAKTDLELSNDGFYDPVLYRNWIFPGIASNAKEDEHAGEARSKAKSQMSLARATYNEKQAAHRSMIRRRPGPSFLIYVSDLDLDSISLDGTDVARFMDSNTFDDYVFVSYTSVQFNTSYDKYDGKSLKRSPEQLRQSHEARLELLRIGIKAAKKAGVPAFWLDCFPRLDGEDARQDPDDVYRICDIVRSSHSMVIALNEAMYEKSAISTNIPTLNLALRDWGSRLWTMPEVLLSKAGQKVPIISLGRPEILQYHKRNLGYIGWPEWEDTMKLIDHYEGSVRLTQLELISIAHKVLRASEYKSFRGGDHAYALMGLLCQRPSIVDNDSDFAAFARLSLSNSSDSILERLLCMQPESKTAPWHQMEDAYGAGLWEIEPTCQIAAIADRDNRQTVVLDGVHGATICWDRLDPVVFVKRLTPTRRLARWLLPISPLGFTIGIMGLSSCLATVLSADAGYTSSEDASDSPESLAETAADVYSSLSVSYYMFIAIFGIFVAMTGVVICTTPVLLRSLFYGNFWSTQARFYGMQGTSSIRDLEKKLFGRIHPSLKCQLRWSVSSSLLSFPKTPTSGTDTDYEGEDPSPASDPLPLQLEDGRYLFTLIDTYTMEVTAFYADRPPTAVMICGKEGGMQRAVLCSYDWRTQTFCRELVLRMKTIVLDRMARVDKFRFSLQR